ncbi:MAG TPA: DMT family transporter [Myxococcota bacterium]|nr:DMT family transporter [Myxococcota bacterium]
MTSRFRAELVLLGVTLAWGGSFLVVKDTLGTLAPFQLIALRFALAVAALAALFGRRAFRLGRDAAGRSHWRGGLAIGLLLWAGFALQTLGLRDTTPARSGFITATYVAMVPLLMRLISGRPLRKRVAAAASAALVGLYLLTGPDGGGANRGDWLTLLGALAFAGHMVALDRGARAMPAPALAFAQMAVVAGVSLPFALAESGVAGALSGRSLAALGYLGLICSAAGFLGQTWGQRHTSPVRVGLIFSLESLFAALLSVALGMEVLTPLQWAGGVLLVGGVVLGELPEAEPVPSG